MEICRVQITELPTSAEDLVALLRQLDYVSHADLVSVE